MQTEQTFLRCTICGNLVGVIHDSGVSMVCCGEDMVRLAANETDGAAEKHVPVARQAGQTVIVRVGAVDHPMLPEHHIEWIYLLTKEGGQRKRLQPSDAPTAQFCVTEGDDPLSCYAYCNLHGLWRGTV